MYRTDIRLQALCECLSHIIILCKPNFTTNHRYMRYSYVQEINREPHALALTHIHMYLIILFTYLRNTLTRDLPDK